MISINEDSNWAEITGTSSKFRAKNVLEQQQNRASKPSRNSVNSVGKTELQNAASRHLNLNIVKVGQRNRLDMNTQRVPETQNKLQE